jgi:signal transduction histidine kinase
MASAARIRQLIDGFGSDDSSQVDLQSSAVDSPFLSLALSALLLAISYYAGVEVGFWLTPNAGAISAFWPPNAILLAVLLLTDQRRWWIFLLAILPAHLLAQLRVGVPLSTALGWFLTNAAEALLGAYGIRRFLGARPRIDRVRGLIVFLGIGVVGAPLVTSFLDAMVVVATGWSRHYWILWTTRLFSNMLAELTIVPAILLVAQDGVSWLRKATFSRCAEAVVLALSIVLVNALVFGSDRSLAILIPTLFYLPLPLLLWASLRFGPAGLSLALLVEVLISSAYWVHGRGTLPSPEIIENVLSLQILLCVITFPLLLLSAILTEKRHIQKSLRESRVRLIDSQERERSRIARELHDDVGQRLALVESELAQLRDESASAVQPRLHEICDQVSEISKTTRDLSHGLHPSHLEYLGLMPALKKLSREFSENRSVEITVTPAELPGSVSPEVSLSVYRIAQEALRNIEKHSKARHVDLHVHVASGRLHMRIVDDGIGFAADHQPSEGLGLANMRERAAAIGGSVVISSSIEGTRVEATLPLSPAA